MPLIAINCHIETRRDYDGLWSAGMLPTVQTFQGFGRALIVHIAKSIRLVYYHYSIGAIREFVKC